MADPQELEQQAKRVVTSVLAGLTEGYHMCPCCGNHIGFVGQMNDHTDNCSLVALYNLLFPEKIGE